MKPQGILLLGGTGFIGRALAVRLSRIFPEIYNIARKKYDWQGIPNIYSFASSLDDTVLLAEILPRCTAVFHLATETTPGASALKPSFEAGSSLLPSLRFLECLQEYPHVRLIYISSGGAVYGNTVSDPVSEETPLSPLSYYGAGKASLEKFIHAFCRQTSNKAVVLRPSNLYGPGQPYKKGFGVVPTIFYHMQVSQPFLIWGNGETVRDYLYIDDFIDFCVHLLENPVENKDSVIYNIGAGRGTTINELCVLAEEVSGKTLIREYRDSRSIDVKSIVLNCSRIQRNYQWNAEVGLRCGLISTWEWFCARKK